MATEPNVFELGRVFVQWLLDRIDELQPTERDERGDPTHLDTSTDEPRGDA